MPTEASFTFIFTAAFGGATWLTIPWLYRAKIFPLPVRATGERLEWKRLNVECPDQDTSLKGGRGRHTIDPPRRHVLLLPIIYLWALYPESEVQPGVPSRRCYLLFACNSLVE
jgi:hypothetical protein